MGLKLTCPAGHAWQVNEASPAVNTHCPICGALSDTLAAGGPTPLPQTLPRPSLDRSAASWPTIPGFQVLEELGQGGAGVVYKARQLELDRLVAIKMLVSGPQASAVERQRFQTEARAVAQLQHPNIVRIYQVGEIEARPYLVMEYLAGGSLSAHCHGKVQPIRWAAQLVRTLALAVHFAHEQGILHRDLKPANVLLERDGTPKVADFGLAKRFVSMVRPSSQTIPTDESTRDDSSLTPPGAVLGTPSYMAPEQAGAETTPLLPSTDVYGLGAILYELLTGRPPFRGTSPVETILQVLHEEPVAPRRLEPSIPRDLETICLKCLEKRSRARYDSASQLADDLARYLEGEPIHARPSGPLDRALKWARRKPAQALLLAVSILALALLLGGLTWHEVLLDQKNKELAGALDATEKQRQRNVGLLRLALRVIEEHGDFADEQLRSLPHTEAVRRQLLEQRLRYYAPILAEEPGDSPMRHTRGLAFLALGIIKQRLRDYAEAEQAFQQALQCLEPTDAENEALADRFDLARVLVQRGTLLPFLKRESEAEESLQRGYRLLEQLVAESPEPSYRRALGVAGNNLAHYFDRRGRYREARTLYENVIRLRQQLADDQPDDDRALWDLFVSYTNLGALDLGRYLAAELSPTERAQSDALAKSARQSFNAARAILQKLAPRHADSVEYHYALAGLQLNLGILDRERSPQEALKAYREAAPLWMQLHSEFPAVPEYTQKAADTALQLALLLESQRQFSAARDSLKQALVLSEQLERQAPQDPAGTDHVNESLYYLGRVQFTMGQYTDGERSLQRSVQRLKTLPVQISETKRRRDLIFALSLLAGYYKAKGEILRKLPPLGLGASSLTLGVAIHELARLFIWQGFLGRAAEYYNESIELTRRAARQDGNSLQYYYSLTEQCMALKNLASSLGCYPEMVRAAEAAEEAARAISSSNPRGGLRFVLAAMYRGCCSRLASEDTHISRKEREGRARQQAQQGLQLLRLAVEGGYRDAANLEQEPELEPVRRLYGAEFARLVSDVKAKKNK